MDSVSVTLLRQAFDGDRFKGHEFITDLSSVTTLTVPTGANKCIIQCEDQNVRWRMDGTDPTSSVGMLLEAGKSQAFVGGLGDLEFIEVASGAELNVTYYGDK